MNQLAKFHKKRIEYRTVVLKYWNGYVSDVLNNDSPDLLKLDKTYPGESLTFLSGIPYTYLTRNFCLNLSDKNPIKVRIFNFTYKTPYFNDDAAAPPDEKEYNEFNKIIFLNSTLFGPYGNIPINMKTNLVYDDGTNTFLYGSETLNSLDFQYTPTKQIENDHDIRFTSVETTLKGTLNVTNPTLRLINNFNNANDLAKIFTISFIVELTYDN